MGSSQSPFAQGGLREATAGAGGSGALGAEGPGSQPVLQPTSGGRPRAAPGDLRTPRQRGRSLPAEQKRAACLRSVCSRRAGEGVAERRGISPAFLSFFFFFPTTNSSACAIREICLTNSPGRGAGRWGGMQPGALLAQAPSPLPPEPLIRSVCFGEEEERFPSATPTPLQGDGHPAAPPVPHVRTHARTLACRRARTRSGIRARPASLSHAMPFPSKTLYSALFSSARLHLYSPRAARLSWRTGY